MMGGNVDNNLSKVGGRATNSPPAFPSSTIELLYIIHIKLSKMGAYQQESQTRQ